MKIDFFQVEIPEGQPEFDGMLRAIDALADGARAQEVAADSSAWLLQLADYNGKVEGNFVRGRSNYLPKKGKAGRHTSVLPLDPDEDVTDESAFIYDPNARVLALQRNRYGLTARGVEVYINRHRSLVQPIELKPLVKKATLARLAKMTTTKKVVVKLARPNSPSTLVDKGDSASDAIRLMNELRSPTLHIEASVGRTGGSLYHAREFARSLLSRNKDGEVDVTSLRISGEIDEAPAFIDLIEDRLVAEVPVESNERRTLPYRNRRSSLRRAWTEQLGELTGYGVTS